jgi:hypothetical protein
VDWPVLGEGDVIIAQGATVEAAARTVGFEGARMLRRLRGCVA